MAQAYGDDLREKVLGAYAAGKGTLRELAERFDVSYGWVAKIHAAELATGSRRRVPQRRRPSAVATGLVRSWCATSRTSRTACCTSFSKACASTATR